jgi:ATP synthase F1 delta subunit
MIITNKSVKTYAKSLFQNLTKDSTVKSSTLYPPSSSVEKTFADIYVVGEELLLLRAIFISSASIRKIFKNPTFTEKLKGDFLLKTFPSLTVTTKSFLKVLAERAHLSLIPEISEEYNSLLLKFKESTKVKIITAGPLDATFGPLILKTLKKLTNSKEVVLNTAFSPHLLGGVVVEYNSVAIDASVLKEFSLFFNDI